MDYFIQICVLLGGLGAFLLGFKLLSTHMERLSTDKLRIWFSTAAKSKLAGVGIGIVATILVNSSAVTTVMSIGLVNASIMTLKQATTIIMGANIGTTLTAHIVALGSTGFTEIAMLLTIIGIFIVMLAKNESLKTWGYIITSFGLVYCGLHLVGDAVDFFKDEAIIKDTLEKVSNPFLLLFIGIILTALMQSSTAVTSIVIMMAGAGGLTIGGGGNAPLYIILGSNIGSCVTALISSVGTSTNAKRAAMIHFLFNVIGSLLFMVMLLIWPNFMSMTFEKWFNSPAEQIAMFHTVFNVTCTLIFLPMTKVLVWLAEKMIPDKQQIIEKENTLDERLLRTPSVALIAALKEGEKMARVAMDTLNLSVMGFINKDDKDTQLIQEKIDETSEINNNITAFLVKLSSKNLNYKDEQTVSSLHASLSDIARIAELADNITRYTNHYIKDGLVFSDGVLSQVKLMLDKTQQLFDEAVKVFALSDKYKTQKADRLEDEIDGMRKDLIDSHIIRLDKGECKPESSGVFMNLVNNVERAGDHILYIAHTFDSNKTHN